KADTEQVEANTYKTLIDAGVLEPYEARWLKYGNALDSIPVPDGFRLPPVEDVPDTTPDDGGKDDGQDDDAPEAG
ncbi:MAG: hypothetical protein IJL80_01055, partial [Treponema sp.]|nr:hypothetical protein [Treponema sp.]